MPFSISINSVATYLLIQRSMAVTNILWYPYIYSPAVCLCEPVVSLSAVCATDYHIHRTSPHSLSHYFADKSHRQHAQTKQTRPLCASLAFSFLPPLMFGPSRFKLAIRTNVYMCAVGATTFVKIYTYSAIYPHWHTVTQYTPEPLTVISF